MGRELPPDEVLGRGPADHRLGAGAAARPGWRATWTSCAPAPTWTCCWARIPVPARTLAAGTTPSQATALAGRGQAARRRRRPPPGRQAARCGRVRRAGHPDRPAGHPDRPGGPARGARRARPGRPVAGPRPGRRGRGQPHDDLVRDRDRRARARHRPRLRPARTQEPQETRRGRRRPTGPDPGSPSPRPAGTGRPADTAPGGCAPPETGRT